MEGYTSGSLHTTIDVGLYKYNYIDNKLWTQLINHTDYIDIDDDSILVSKNQIETILNYKWVDEINKFKSIAHGDLHKNINTIYFLWLMMAEMTNLSYIKFTRKYDKKYTRIKSTETGNKIQFEFKILTSTVNLGKIYPKAQLSKINKVLEELDLIKHPKPYTRIRTSEIISILEDYLNSLDDLENPLGSPYIVDLLDILTEELSYDNPTILLITDY